MALNDILQVTVSTAAPAITTLGFGTPLVLSSTATFPNRTKDYYNIAEVEADFADPYCSERLAMGAIFAQTSPPRVVKMGKCANVPTMRYKISAITPTDFDTTTYALRVIGEAFDEEIDFTTDADATDAEFAAALVSALNGVSGKNYSASGSSSPVTVTATAAGDFFSIEVLDRRLMSLEIDHADPGVAADLTAIRNYDADFTSVIGTQFSDAMIAACAVWCNTNQKLFLFDTPNTKAVTEAAGAGNDPIDDAATLEQRFVSGWFHPSPAAFLSAAVNAACLPLKPGSETWAFKRLQGVAAVSFTPTERANLVAKYGNSYESVRNVSVTFDGRTSSGSWIDFERAALWAIDQIQVDFFNFIAAANTANTKVGFDEKGRVALEGNFKASLRKLINSGLMAEAGATVFVPALADVPSGDKANRHYSGIVISGDVLGAVQSGGVSLVFN